MAKDKRLFARLDLDYADHPKIGMLSDSAFRAHIEMILYSRKYMTDGGIPKRVANRFASESLTELLTNDEEAPSLIDLGDGSYLLYGFADMNETREEIEHRTRVNIENGRRGGLAKKRLAKQTATDSLSKRGSEKASENVAETETETETENKGAKRGSRVPDSFSISDEMRSWAATDVPLVNVDSKLAEWLDYWRGVPGVKGVKLDWVGTWRNGMRKQQEFAERDAPKPTPKKRRFNDEVD